MNNMRTESDIKTENNRIAHIIDLLPNDNNYEEMKIILAAQQQALVWALNQEKVSSPAELAEEILNELREELGEEKKK